MNIMEKLLPWRHADETEGAVEEREPKRTERTHGPVKMRRMTNGQMRRAYFRAQETAERKRAVAFRRRWMDNRQAVAVLRGQLEVLDKRSVPAIERDLTEKFGSVDEARVKYAEILAEAGA